MRPIFISYRRSWSAEVTKLAESLRLHGLRVFLDYSDAAQLTGPAFPDALRRVIREESGAMLLHATSDIEESSAIWKVEVPTGLQRADREQDFFIVPFFRDMDPIALRQMTPYGPELAACNGIIALPLPGTSLDSFLGGKHAEAAKLILERVLRNKAGVITLCLQTREAGPANTDADLFLDWRSVYPDNRPSPDGCIAALAALKDLTGAVSKAATRRIHVQAKAHLSAGIALGAALTDSAGFEMEIEQRDQIWSPRDVLEPFDLQITKREINPDFSDICMTVAITRPETMGSVKHAQARLDISCRGWIEIQPKAGSSRQSIPSGGCARSIAQQVATALMEARAEWGVRKTHLFVSAPFALAVLIGQELNALGTIDVYEHVKLTDEYVKAFTL